MAHVSRIIKYNEKKGMTQMKYRKKRKTADGVSEMSKTLDGSNKHVENSSKYMMVSVDKKNQLDVTFVFFISLLIVAQHVPGNHVPIIRS